MTTAEHNRRTALNRERRFAPSGFSFRKPGELSKQDLKDMLRVAAANTVRATDDETDEAS